MWRRHRLQSLERGLLEGLTVVGMGNLDESPGALAQRLAEEVGDAELRADVVNVGAGGDNTGANLQSRDNFAFAFVRDGWQCDDGFAATVEAFSGSSDEVDLSTEAGVHAGADRVGADLAGQVDLDARVDGGHFRVLADDFGVVDVVDLQHLDERVVVDEVVELLGAHEETADDSAAVDLLLVVRDASLLHQIHDATGEHLAVDSEILVVVQLGENGVGDVANAHLEGCTVLDEVLGDPLADGFFLRAHLAVRVDGERSVDVDGCVEVRLVDDGVAEGSWHLLVHLGYDLLGVLASGADLEVMKVY